MEEEINKLNWEQLVELKDKVDLRLSEVERMKAEYEASRKLNVLSDLRNTDKVFCIHLNDDSFINIDFVVITFSECSLADGSPAIDFQSYHEKKRMGCRGFLKIDDLGKYCLLIGYPDDMYFFTLKPETWKEDLQIKTTKFIKSKRTRAEAAIQKFEDNITDLLENNDAVNIFLKNCSND